MALVFDSKATSYVVLGDVLSNYLADFDQVLRRSDFERLVLIWIDHLDFNKARAHPIFLDSRTQSFCIEADNFWTQSEFEKRIPWRQSEVAQPTRFMLTSLKDASKKNRAHHIYTQLQNSHRVLLAKNAVLDSKFIGDNQDSFDGLINRLCNLREFTTTPDPRHWRNALTGVPAVVLGAGPSLESSMPWLNDRREDLVIFAPDTLYRALRSKGFKNVLYFTIERGPSIPSFFLGSDSSETGLLNLNSVSPLETYTRFHGLKSAVMSPDGLNEFFPFKRIVLQHGHSCVGYALQMSKVLGAGPVFLLGIDLCYDSASRSHSTLAPYEQNDFEHLTTNLRKQLMESVIVENSKGEKVQSNVFWQIFQKEFSQMLSSATQVYFNLSDSGLPIAHARAISVSEANSLVSKRDLRPTFESLVQKLNYDRHTHAILELKNFGPVLEDVLIELESLISGLKNSLASHTIIELRKSRHYDRLYRHIFDVAVSRFDHSVMDYLDIDREEILKLMQLLPQEMQNANETVRTLVRDAEENRIRLY